LSDDIITEKELNGMPYVNCYNLDKEEVLELSNEILAELASACKCPKDWFCFNGINGYSIVENELKKDFVLIKIEWFKRDEATKQAVVQIIDKTLRAKGYNEIVVTFSDIDKDNFYEDGAKVK
jgi:hypothetical protein